jgi:hypothetical protein
MSIEMSATLGLPALEPRLDPLDALLDVASETGGRITWGRSRLTRRHWVAVQLHNGKIRVRRAKTRAEAARLILRDVYPVG